jgi:homoserine kinase
MDVIRLPVPAALRVVLVHPAQQLRTREARAVLPEKLARDVALAQAANIAAMVAGACLGDLHLIGRALVDRIAEPVRAPLLPGFLPAKEAALEAGALGCSISGAGPTVFALVDDAERGRTVADAMVAAYRLAGIAASGRIATVDTLGARVE